MNGRRLLNTSTARFNTHSTPFQHPLSPCRLADSTVSTVLCEGIDSFSKITHADADEDAVRARAVWFLSLHVPVESVEYTRRRRRGGVEWVLKTDKHPLKQGVLLNRGC